MDNNSNNKEIEAYNKKATDIYNESTFIQSIKGTWLNNIIDYAQLDKKYKQLKNKDKAIKIIEFYLKTYFLLKDLNQSKNMKFACSDIEAIFEEALIECC